MLPNLTKKRLKAIKQTQFEELQKMEKNDIFQKVRENYFFERKTGAWKEELSVNLIKK